MGLSRPASSNVAHEEFTGVALERAFDARGLKDADANSQEAGSDHRPPVNYPRNTRRDISTPVRPHPPMKEPGPVHERGAQVRVVGPQRLLRDLDGSEVLLVRLLALALPAATRSRTLRGASDREKRAHEAGRARLAPRPAGYTSAPSPAFPGAPPGCPMRSPARDDRDPETSRRC